MPFLLFAGGISILFFACAQFSGKHSLPVHYLILGGCLGAVYLLLYLWAAEIGIIEHLPAMVGSDISMIFLSTPAFYLSSLSILNEGRLRVRSYTIYFIGPVVFTIIFGLYNAITAPALIQKLGTAPGQFSTPILTILTALAFSGYTGAVILALLTAHRIWKSGRVRDVAGFRHQVFFLFLYLTAALNGLIIILLAMNGSSSSLPSCSVQSSSRSELPASAVCISK